MRRLWQVARLLWSADGWAMTRGALAGLVVLLMGAALLGLSGWFILATGAAGLAGIGIAFDVFRPSAGVRFLALGRAGARYAERLLTHDATLRALTALRLRLLDRLSLRPVAALAKLRSGAALTQITADVDALDGLLLRLVLPVVSGVLTLGTACLALVWLVSFDVALSVLAGCGLAAGLVLMRTGQAALAPARQREAALQGYRHRLIGLLRGQADAIVSGRLAAELDAIQAAERRVREAETRLNRIDLRAGFALSVLVTLTAAVVLGQGASLDPATGAIGFFVVLALAEVLLPLARGVTELGRVLTAAERLDLTGEQGRAGETLPVGKVLRLDGVSVAAPGRVTPLFAPLSLTLEPGQTLAITAPSGGGKSSLLAVLAGVASPLSGQVTVPGRVTLLPQRAQLVSGTVRENLALAKDGMSDAEGWAALEAVQLAERVRADGGLDMMLGEAGAGLSGGEQRRLALARVLLHAPDLALLDEPTEGLGTAQAAEVLRAIRAALPRAVIVMASHRAAEQAQADRVLALEHITSLECLDSDQVQKAAGPIERP